MSRESSSIHQVWARNSMHYHCN